MGPGAPSMIAGLVKQLKRIDQADAQLAKMLAAREERELDHSACSQIRRLRLRT